MMSIVEYLNQGVADQIRQVLLTREKFEIFVDCEEGGNYLVAKNLAEEIESSQDVTAKIRHAESAAAIVALACKRRVIEKDGTIVLHLGNACFLGSQMLEGIFLEHASRFEELVLWQIIWLETRFPLLKESPEMSELLITNSVSISSGRALELGLVDEIA